MMAQRRGVEGLRALFMNALILLLVAPSLSLTEKSLKRRSVSNSSMDSFPRGQPLDFMSQFFLEESTWLGQKRPKDQRTAYACEQTPLQIGCDANKGEVIRIIRANYGRFSITICNPHGVTQGWNLQCMSIKSLKIVSERCDGWTQCNIMTNNALFGDPCADTFKYLEVQYHCAKEPPPSTRRTTTTVSTTTSEIVATTTSSTEPHLLSTLLSTLSTRQPTIHQLYPTTHSPTPHGPLSPITTPAPNIPPNPTTIIKPNTGHQTETQHTETKGDNPVYITTTTPVTTRQPVTTTTTPNPDSTYTTRSTTPSKGPLPIQFTFCKETRRSEINWPRTNVGIKAVMDCPGDLVGVIAWECSQYGWVGEPDDTNCKSLWLQHVIDEVKESVPVERVMKAIEGNTANKILKATDLKITASIMNKMAERLMVEKPGSITVQETAEDMVQSVSNLLSSKQRGTWSSLESTERTKVATSLVITVEETAFAVANTVDIQMTANENILFEVNVVKTMEHDLTMPTMTNGHSAWADNSDSITIPKESLQQHSKNGKVSVVFVAYNNLGEWMGSGDPTDSGSEDNPSKEKITDSDSNPSSSNGVETSPKWAVNTKIISTSLNNRVQNIPLAKPVTFLLEHTNASINLNPKCSFWNYSDTTKLGHWADAGCKLRTTNKTHTECECDHLTNFAVLMDVAGTMLPAHHELPLQVITYAGCLISIFCLILAFITFIMFKNLQCDRNTIHKNLVLSLLIAESIFLAGIQQSENPIICAIIAGFLHFFFLASFAWMCLEGIQLYIMLIEVFEAERSRVKWYYLFGYGVPAVIVGVSAAVDHQGYGTDNHCWLRTDTYFIWSFVGPVAAVITVNIVMLSIAVYMMCRHATTVPAIRTKEKPKLEKYSSQDVESGLKVSAYNGDLRVKRVSDVPEFPCGSLARLQPSPSDNSMAINVRLAWIKGAAVLVVLLGLTWSFGILYINENTVAMAYLFTILNSLQGLFIFVFHCLMNEKVQKEYRKVARRTSWLPECIRVKYGGYTGYSQSTTPNQSSSSGNNYFSKLWSGRKRKKSTSSILGKSNSSPSRKRKSSRPISGSRDSSSVLTPLSNQNGFVYTPDTQNGHLKPQQRDNGGINGDLSMVDCSVVDSEFVSEYCQENMKSHKDTPLRSNVSGQPYNADQSIYHVYEEPHFKNKKNLHNSDDSIVKNRFSFISTDTKDGIHYSEVSDEELFQMTEKDKRMSQYEREPLVSASKSERELIDETGDRKRNPPATLKLAQKTSPSLGDLSPDSKTDEEDKNLSTPNLKYKESRSGSEAEVEDSLLQGQASLPNISTTDDPDHGELSFGSFDESGSTELKPPNGRKVKRLSSDLKTKHDPHRYRLNTSSDC